MAKRWVWCGVLLPVLSGVAGAGQTAAAPERLATGGVMSSLTAAPVLGQPFSAVQVTHTVQTLADGSTVKHNGHHGVARDAEGRVRVEMRMAKAAGDRPEMVMIFVMDPVAHTLTTWVTGAKDGHKVASVVKLPREGSKTSAAGAPAAAQAEGRRPQVVKKTETLEAETVEGLPVSVTKTTTVIPPGRSGNEAPITTTHEMWTSADLKLVVKQVWEDPRTGERTVELEHMSRAEPDAAMFRPPAGYQVKDAVETLKELTEKLEAEQGQP